MHVHPCEPTTTVEVLPQGKTPWWNQSALLVGYLSRELTRIRLVNTLTNQSHELIVPARDLVRNIRERYLKYNWHAKAYMWKALHVGDPGSGIDFEFRPLDMDLTLSENGVEVDQAEFDYMGVHDVHSEVVIHLDWADDLTVA